MMRILHIAETAKGGVGSYLSQLVPLQTGHFGIENISVIIPADHAPYVKGLTPEQIVCFSRPGRSLRSLFNLGTTIRRVVRTFRPDIIHTHSTFAGGVVRCSFAAVKDRPRIVYCPHGWAFNVQAPPAVQVLIATVERALSLVTDRVVAISDFEAAEARRIGIKPVKVMRIHNGIGRTTPAVMLADWPDTRRKILFVGRLDRQKGFDLLVQAVEGLEDRLAVRVAGVAVRADQTQDAAANIEYLGWLSAPEIAGQIQAADVVVMPSRWEGFGLTAIEAMREAKPVIACKVGGLPEIIVPGITGRLVPPEDVGALRAALLHDDIDALRNMGLSGRQRFLEHFTADRMDAAILALYSDLMAECAATWAAKAPPIMTGQHGPKVERR